MVTFTLVTNQGVEYTFELNKKEIICAAKFMYQDGLCARYNVNSDKFYEQTLKNKAFYRYFGHNENFNLISMMLDGLKVTFITAQRLYPVEKKKRYMMTIRLKVNLYADLKYLKCHA